MQIFLKDFSLCYEKLMFFYYEDLMCFIAKI